MTREPPDGEATAGEDSGRGTSAERRDLEEFATPGHAPAWSLEPVRRWHPNRIRAWLIASSIAVTGFMLAGLFILILLDITGERLLVWQAAMTSVITPVAGVTGYYFSRVGDKDGNHL